MSCQPKLPRRILCSLVCMAMLAGPALAAEVNSGQVYCFSPDDFSEEEALTGVCITGIPDNGSIRLGSRIIRSGDVLTARQLEQMTFAPTMTQADAAAVISYLPIYSDGVAPEATVTISIHGRKDQAPVAEDSAIETYKNLPNEGLLKVMDPEGQAMIYTLVRSPKRGEVIIREDGSFLYTPKKNKVGTDSFTFTATDPAGNVSREATITVTVLKPTDDIQYSDTMDSDCRFEAEWMRQTGIFSGETISGEACFSPDEPVTRGQFLAMLMETLELPVDSSAAYTGFVDESASWLKPYLAAAMRAGIVYGYRCENGMEFRPDQIITGAEAEVMMNRALDLAVPTFSAEEELLNGTAEVTRADAAVALYRLSTLAKEQSVWSSLFR